MWLYLRRDNRACQYPKLLRRGVRHRRRRHRGALLLYLLHLRQVLLHLLHLRHQQFWQLCQRLRLGCVLLLHLRLCLPKWLRMLFPFYLLQPLP